MAKKKMSRKELLKRPDELSTLSSKAVALASTHQQPLKYAGVAIAVIIIAYFAFRAWTKSMNAEGQAKSYDSGCETR